MLTVITESEISYVLPPLGFFHMLCLWFLLKMCYVAGHTVACQLSAVMKMSLWAIDTSYEEITVLIHNCSSDMKQYITTSTTKKTSETQYTPFFFLRTIIQNETSLHAQKGTWGCFIRAKPSALCIVATQNTLRKSPWCSLVETDCSRRKCYAWDLTETNLPPLLLPFPLSL